VKARRRWHAIFRSGWENRGHVGDSTKTKLRERRRIFRARNWRVVGSDGVDRLVELATLPEADLVLIASWARAGCARRWRRSRRQGHRGGDKAILVMAGRKR